ncbi:MAG TPA: TonB family protein, partial [Thermoanaerobaculia bacterium]|nr:TonB family protein [Thermoanaerobaculia bacterium]
VATLTATAKIDFTQLRRSGQVEAIRRAKPKVEKPEQTPAAPSLALEQASSSDARAEVSALAAPLGVGGGAGIGGILGVGGGFSGGGGLDRDPVPLVRIDPQYPSQAQQRRLEGWVHVRFTISGAGTVKGAKVVKSSDLVFESAALRAVEQWKYQPQMDAGKPIDREGVDVIIRFTLKA